MATSELVEQLSQTLECGICLDQFKEPRGLPCLHCFCHGCLETYCKGRKQVPCPSCKRDVTVPEEGVTGFPTHFIMNTLQETVDQIITAREARTETEPASVTKAIGSDDIAEAITGQRSMPVDPWDLEVWGLQNEQTRSRNYKIDKDSPRKTSMQFDEVRPTDNVYGFESYSVVEISKKNGEKLYGVLHWMGENTQLGPMAGIELEEKLTAGGSNGTLFGKRYFTCEAGRAIFVKLSSVRPDSRFSFQTETLTTTNLYTSQDEITTAQLMEIAKEMGTRWQLLASDLKVPRKQVLSLVGVDMLPEDICAQMLIRWQKALPPGNNGRKDLIDALESCERHDLVVKVLEPRANEITTAQIIEIAKEMGTRWQLLAHDLKVPRKQVLSLADVDIKLEDKCAQMLIRWQEALPLGNDGRNNLIDALNSCERHDLVEIVLEPRVDGQTTPISVIARQNLIPTHQASARDVCVKAAKNAAMCYKNYADASAPICSSHNVPSTTRSIECQIDYDREFSRQQSAESVQSSSSSSEFTSLPASSFRMSLSEDAYLYSRPNDTPVIGGQNHQINHPLNTRTDYSPNGIAVVADAHMPRNHPTRISPTTPTYHQTQYNKYPGSSNSASRLARHGIKELPSATTDDEWSAVLGDYSPNRIAVVADAHMPRNHPTRISPTTPTYHQTQYNKYPGSSNSASRLARHGIKEPPSATTDDEWSAVLDNMSH